MAVLPVVKSIYVCDEVRRNAHGRKVDMVGACNAAYVPAEESFPYSIPLMSVLVQMSGGIGTANCTLLIVQASTQSAIYTSSNFPITFRTRHSTAYVAVKLNGISFPEAGEYWIEWYCKGMILDDKLFQIID